MTDKEKIIYNKNYEDFYKRLINEIYKEGKRVIDNGGKKETFNVKRSIFKVDSDKRELHLPAVCDTLAKMQMAFKDVFNIDNEEAGKIINRTLDNIAAIRFDYVDKDVQPVKSSVEEFTDNGNKSFKYDVFWNGVTNSSKGTHNIVIIAPALGEPGGDHTFVHEFVHACSIWGNNCKGVWDGKKRDLFEALNEGVTESIAERLMRKINTDVEPEGRDEVRVKTVTYLFSLLAEDKQLEAMQHYIKGEGEQVLEILKDTDINGQSMYESLKQLSEDGAYIENDKAKANRKSFEKNKRGAEHIVKIVKRGGNLLEKLRKILLKNKNLKKVSNARENGIEEQNSLGTIF